MLNKPILVLGSKPGSQIPNIDFKKIYTANGAAERGMLYKKKFMNSQLNCLVAMREFLKVNLVREKILNSNPNRVIFRTTERDISDLFQKDCKLEYMNWSEQFNFQCKYVGFSPFSILLGEIKRNEKILDKFKYIFNCIRRKQFWGISTGFFAIIFAHEENPESDIVVSGVGMTGGAQFYESERSKKFNYTPRARVDRFVAKFINNNLKSKIYSVDDDFVKNTKTKKLII